MNTTTREPRAARPLSLRRVNGHRVLSPKLLDDALAVANADAALRASKANHPYAARPVAGFSGPLPAPGEGKLSPRSERLFYRVLVGAALVLAMVAWWRVS